MSDGMTVARLGERLERTEDARLLTGQGRYTDDLAPEGCLHCVIVRSRTAHARILHVSVERAAAMPAVALVLTAADLAAEGVKPFRSAARLKGADGGPNPETLKSVLASDRIRWDGEPIAAVIASSRAAALAAAALVEVEIEPLPPVTDVTSEASTPIWPHISDNRSIVWDMGTDVEAAMAGAARVVALDVSQNRVVANPLEPRVALGDYDRERDLLTLTTPSQGVHGLHGHVSRMMGLAPERLRVVTPDVGGGFGMKIFPYAEHILVLVAARRLGRPVKWTGTREEAFLGDVHGRPTRATARLALDAAGRIAAYDLGSTADLGAYHATYGPYNPTTFGGRIFAGVYDVQAVHVHVVGALTNAAPIDAYRGAGRPEATYYIERLMDEAGRATGIGPFEIRRRNVIPVAKMPYRNWFGTTIDEGDFAWAIDAAEAAVDFPGLEARRAAAKARGRRRGLGVALYMEITAGGEEEAGLTLGLDGRITATVGTQSNGQGHETSFAQILSARLGVPLGAIAICQGDTATIPSGGGTGGSRSLHLAGGALDAAAQELIAAAKPLAAEALQADPAGVSFAPERGFVSGGASVGLEDLARLLARRPSPMPLSVAATYRSAGSTFPYGCHVAEVEIDEETGEIDVVDYVAADDFGFLVNPLLVEGQIVGGVAQGLGQALVEGVRYDRETGALLTRTFETYAMPRAFHMPKIRHIHRNAAALHNPLGVKGCGEAGTVGSLSAVTNAVADALGRSTLTLPLLPERVWRYMQAEV